MMSDEKLVKDMTAQQLLQFVEEIIDQNSNKERRKIATVAMQAMIGVIENRMSFTGNHYEKVARESVQYADALINELNKTK